MKQEYNEYGIHLFVAKLNSENELNFWSVESVLQ